MCILVDTGLQRINLFVPLDSYKTGLLGWQISCSSQTCTISMLLEFLVGDLFVIHSTTRKIGFVVYFSTVDCGRGKTRNKSALDDGNIPRVVRPTPAEGVIMPLAVLGV